MDKSQRLDALTSLRFFVALQVMLFHYGLLPHILERYGYSGVSFFFVLSGFVLQWSYGDRVGTPEERKRFWFLRAARLYPTHWLLLAYFVIMLGSRTTWLDFWLSFTLTKAWFIQALKVDGTLNAVSWTISTEMFFYLSFPFLALLRTRTLALGAMAGFTFYAALSFVPFTEPVGYLTYYASVPPRLLDFILGMLSSRLVMAQGKSLSPALWVFTGIASVGLAQTLEWSGWANKDLPFALSAAVLIVGMSLPSLWSRLLSWSPLVFLGDSSFMLYMIHIAVERTWQLPLWTLAGIAVALSAVLHVGFDSPLQRTIRRFGSSRKGSVQKRDSVELSTAPIYID